jgi:type IV pilus assembly protein PilZ
LPDVTLDDKRKNPRLTVNVVVKYQDATEFFKDYTQNISIGGMFIKSDRAVDYGTKVVFKFELPEIRFPIKGLGEVVRLEPNDEQKTSKRGFAIKFLSFQRESEQLLREFIGEQTQKPK